jgi:hypothetical protein
MRALQKKRAHGDSSHDVSNRWVGSQRSVPNLKACPAMVPIALSFRIARPAGGRAGSKNAPKVEERRPKRRKPERMQATKLKEGWTLGLGKLL